MMEYPYIRVWGKLMGSFDWAIEQEIAKAVAQKAPANATFLCVLDGDGNAVPVNMRRLWSTTEDITTPGLREKFRIECQRLGVPHPWADQPF